MLAGPGARRRGRHGRHPREGFEVRRGHAFDPAKQHGFIDSQKRGMEVFRQIPPEAPLVVVEAVWQYSHHVLHGLYTHRGPILTVANWSGEWPGLVGLLNLNGSLTKAGVQVQLPVERRFHRRVLPAAACAAGCAAKPFTHDLSHVRPLERASACPQRAAEIGSAPRPPSLRRDKAIMGVFDEGCMGMYNAIIPDELLHPTGVFKERLSQSALYRRDAAGPRRRSAAPCAQWLDAQGHAIPHRPQSRNRPHRRPDPRQCKMYIAALRIADEFGCDAIGIQYQQGLKDLAPASDLAEGLLNNVDRPPVTARQNGRVLYEGRALPHFNEVDECAGLDALVTNRVWTALGFDPETTLHDVRYGEAYRATNSSGCSRSPAPCRPQHFIGGYAGAVSERQPPMYFRLGGGTLKGVSKPGEIVWSRVFVDGGKLKADLGLARVDRTARRRKPSAAGGSPRRSGPSCTP